MRQKNDGRGRMGGRGKGTPNRVTADLKAWLFKLIDSNRMQVKRDLKALEPKERLQIIEKLLQYVLPKQQAIAATPETLEELTEIQIDKIISEITRGVEVGEQEDGD